MSNRYEEKKQARIERYERLAEQNELNGQQAINDSYEMISSIPAGQPILVGHHSEKRHRNYLKRSENKMIRGISLVEKATYYKDKAEAAKNNTAISSDDPEALTKLREKVQKLESAHKEMVAINRYYRKHGTCVGFKGLSDDIAKKLDQKVENGYSWETAPYASYTLQNDNQNIKRLKNRIKALEYNANTEWKGWEFDGGKVQPNLEQNRLQVFFDEKPDLDMRTQLKRSGFRWSPYNKAWQVSLNKRAYFVADQIDCIKPLNNKKPSEIQFANTIKDKKKTKEMEL